MIGKKWSQVLCHKVNKMPLKYALNHKNIHKTYSFECKATYIIVSNLQLLFVWNLKYSFLYIYFVF